MNAQRLLERFLKYVQCDSEFYEEREFCLMVEEELRSMGIEPYRDQVGPKTGSNGWNIQAFIPGEGEPIMFSCHTDTVTPGKGIRPVVRDGVVYSSGDTILASDDKAGIAALLEALQCVLEEGRPHRPVELMFSVCEEMGLQGAKHGDYSRFKSRQAVVLDSSSFGYIINGAPAMVRMYFTLYGRSAHAGLDPEAGISALKAAAEAVTAIPSGKVDEDTTMNVANLLAPGKTNIVSDKASFDMEIRCFSAEGLESRIQAAEAAVKAACEKYGTTYELTVDHQSGLVLVPEDSPLIKRLQQVYAKLGLKTGIRRAFGGSDVTWINAAGIEAVNVGTGMTDCHAVTEHIAIADMELTCRMIEEMMA